MEPTTLQEVTDYLVTQLKAHGISLLYYHAYSTNSRYVKKSTNSSKISYTNAKHCNIVTAIFTKNSVKTTLQIKNPRKDFGHKQNTSKERNINYVYQRNHWNSEQ